MTREEHEAIVVAAVLAERRACGEFLCNLADVKGDLRAAVTLRLAAMLLPLYRNTGVTIFPATVRSEHDANGSPVEGE